MRKASQEKIDIRALRIMECRKSGLPDTIRCKENGIAPSSLYYWINYNMLHPVVYKEIYKLGLDNCVEDRAISRKEITID